jgi:hypothetical protein
MQPIWRERQRDDGPPPVQHSPPADQPRGCTAGLAARGRRRHTRSGDAACPGAAMAAFGLGAGAGRWSIMRMRGGARKTRHGWRVKMRGERARRRGAPSRERAPCKLRTPAAESECGGCSAALSSSSLGPPTGRMPQPQPAACCALSRRFAPACEVSGHRRRSEHGRRAARLTRCGRVLTAFSDSAGKGRSGGGLGEPAEHQPAHRAVDHRF